MWQKMHRLELMKRVWRWWSVKKLRYKSVIVWSFSEHFPLNRNYDLQCVLAILHCNVVVANAGGRQKYLRENTSGPRHVTWFIGQTWRTKVCLVGFLFIFIYTTINSEGGKLCCVRKIITLWIIVIFISGWLQQQDSTGPGAGSKTALTLTGDARKAFTAYEGSSGRNECGVERIARCKFINLNIEVTNFTIIVLLHIVSVCWFSKS